MKSLKIPIICLMWSTESCSSSELWRKDNECISNESRVIKIYLVVLIFLELHSFAYVYFSLMNRITELVSAKSLVFIFS